MTLESTLHKHWSASEYHEPFTKKWWSAQQGLARAIDRQTIHMHAREIDALVASWEWAAKMFPAPTDAHPTDYPVMIGELDGYMPSVIWQHGLQVGHVYDCAHKAMGGKPVAVIPLDVYRKLSDYQARAADAPTVELDKDDRITELERELADARYAYQGALVERDALQQEELDAPEPLSARSVQVLTDVAAIVPGTPLTVSAEPYPQTATPTVEEMRSWHVQLDGPTAEPAATQELVSKRPPDLRVKLAPPTLEERVRAHAERAGYEWREYTDRWLVAKDKQWILCCVHGAADPIRGRVGTAWVQMSEESALRFAESWPSTPNHTACELVQEWEVEPPDPGDSALEEHLAEQELIERYTMTARALANRWYLASQAIDAIAVLLGLGDWDDPQQVVDAVRERVGQWVEGPPQETGEYWLVIRFHDGSVSVDPSPHHITKLPLQPDGVDVVAHTPVSRPRYP